MRDPKDLRTLETINLIPVDLNSLLYNAERTIAAFAFVRNGRGDDTLFRRFTQRASVRGAAILQMFDPKAGFFFDRRWTTRGPVAGRPSFAAGGPPYFRLAPDQQSQHLP